MQGLDVIGLIEAVVDSGIGEHVRPLPQYGALGILLLDRVVAAERGFGDREQQVDREMALQVGRRGVAERVADERDLVTVLALANDVRPGGLQVGVVEDIGRKAKFAGARFQDRNSPRKQVASLAEEKG